MTKPNPMFSALTHPTADLERTLGEMRARVITTPQWGKDIHDDTIRQIEAELQNRRDALDNAVRQNSAGAIVRSLRMGR